MLAARSATDNLRQQITRRRWTDFMSIQMKKALQAAFVILMMLAPSAIAFLLGYFAPK